MGRNAAKRSPRTEGANGLDELPACVGAAHAEHPTNHGWAAVFGTRHPENFRFSATAAGSPLRVVHTGAGTCWRTGASRRHSDYDWAVHPAGRLHPVGRDGVRLLYVARTARLLSN